MGQKSMNKFGNIEILTPSCNLSTIDDGRGGIFTWIPDEPLKEFNMLYFKPGKVRGNHYHPEFTEYFLIKCQNSFSIIDLFVSTIDPPDLR